MKIKELKGISPGNYYYDYMGQLKRMIYEQSEKAFKNGNIARDGIRNIKELQERQATMRAKFIEAIGDLPSCETPLNSKVLGTIECDGFRIEKIIFESRPKTFITANLYIPDGIEFPRAAVLFLCGHSEQAKAYPVYQTVCQYLVRAGLIVMAQDPIGQGERFSYYEKKLNATTIDWGCPEHDYVGAQCLPLGDCLARYFVHDAMRGIDYLCTRPEVNRTKIGVTGSSGGGTQTSLVMICDPRIAAAAPATFLTNRQTNMYTGIVQDHEQNWPGMTAIGFDHEDILIAMAPKPTLVLAVDGDYFPIEGTKKTVSRVERFWEMYNKRSNIELFVDHSTHMYTQAMAKKAAEFFSIHLLGNKVSPEDEKICTINPSSLVCTKSGQVRGEIEGARFVYEENLDRLSKLKQYRNSLPETERKKMALAWLKERVFAYRKPCELNPRFYLTKQAEELTVQMCFWWSQEGVFNHAFTFRGYAYVGQDLPVTIAVWDGGTAQFQHHVKWIRETCNSGRVVMVLDVSGEGGLTPNALNVGASPLDFVYETSLGVIFKLACDLLWLNDSMAALRTYDVIRALDMVEKWPGLKKDDIQLYAHGKQGIYAELAAALDNRIMRVEVTDGIGSFANWVGEPYYDSFDIMSIVLPGVLKYFDLHDIAQWIADK